MHVSKMDIRKKGFSEYTSLEKAREITLSETEILEKEVVHFDDSLERVSAEEVVSKVDVPPFDRAAMDGFAVRAEDTFGADENTPKELEIVDSVKIGSSPTRGVESGEAAEIATGAPMPEGSDATVKFEETVREESKVNILAPVSPGKNVSPKGEDFEKGQTVLQSGRRIRPSDVGILAFTKNLKISVRKKPKVGIAMTGDELKDVDTSLDPGEITEVNGYTLAHSIEKLGGEFERLGILPDDLEEIKGVLKGASDFDMMVFTGGSSVGEKDLVPLAIDEVGDLYFHGVGMRPGGPCAFGVVNETLVFSLPGFPAATLVAFETLLKPVLRKMLGLPPLESDWKVRGVLDRKISSSLGRVDVVRVELVREDGGYTVKPLRVTGSSVLKSISGADGVVLVPENKEGYSEGEKVDIRPIDL
mgnify:CR=1 FL=1